MKRKQQKQIFSMHISVICGLILGILCIIPLSRVFTKYEMEKANAQIEDERFCWTDSLPQWKSKSLEHGAEIKFNLPATDAAIDNLCDYISGSELDSTELIFQYGYSISGLSYDTLADNRILAAFGAAPIDSEHQTERPLYILEMYQGCIVGYISINQDGEILETCCKTSDELNNYSFQYNTELPIQKLAREQAGLGSEIECQHIDRVLYTDSSGVTSPCYQAWFGTYLNPRYVYLDCMTGEKVK